METGKDRSVLVCKKDSSCTSTSGLWELVREVERTMGVLPTNSREMFYVTKWSLHIKFEDVPPCPTPRYQDSRDCMIASVALPSRSSFTIYVTSTAYLVHLIERL